MIKGLTYIPDYITSKEHDDILEIVNKQKWNNDLKRRVQHWGYKYDYKKRKVDNSMYLGKLPDWLLVIGSKMLSDSIIEKLPDQVIVNEYLRGQGIAPHIDCLPCFGDTIISLSLSSTCLIEFRNRSETKEIFLKPKGLLIIRGEARNYWTHGISPRMFDMVGEEVVERGTRISLTFRTVKL